MSNEQHEMYTENVNDEQNSNQVHDNNSNNDNTSNPLETSPQGQGSKRKRDDDISTVDDVNRERRASLKRTNAIPPNSSFMAVNQSGPPTAPMAFAGVVQGPGSMNGTGQDSTVGLGDQLHGLPPQMAVPQPGSISFAPEGAVRVGGPLEASYNTIPPPVSQDQQQQQQQMLPAQSVPNIGHHGHPPAPAPPTPAPKPAVGTEEWHKVRRDNHKEVERRRRETINEGINELAKIVPGCEKNKGSILQRAVQYIQQLKENEATNIEKWTLEKLLTEQAIAELTTSNEKLKQECERAWREAETWKKSCLAATEGNRNAENSTSSS